MTMRAVRPASTLLKAAVTSDDALHIGSLDADDDVAGTSRPARPVPS